MGLDWTDPLISISLLFPVTSGSETVEACCFKFIGFKRSTLYPSSSSDSWRLYILWSPSLVRVRFGEGSRFDHDWSGSLQVTGIFGKFPNIFYQLIKWPSLLAAKKEPQVIHWVKKTVPSLGHLFMINNFLVSSSINLYLLSFLRRQEST